MMLLEDFALMALVGLTLTVWLYVKEQEDKDE